MDTILFIEFSEAQWQLTPMSVMKSCQNSNLSKLLLCVLLSARMKKMHQKIKALEWSKHFPIISNMDFSTAQRQLTHKSLVGSCRILN